MFPSGTSGEEPTCQCRRDKRCGFHPELRISPERHGNPLYSCLEKPIDRRSLAAPVHGVAKTWT